MWFDPFVQGRIEGRRYVPREGQHEYLHPDFLSGRDGDQQKQGRVPRKVVTQLIVMAMVMIVILVALILIFT
ncbi:MAG: hypothetical protein ABI658_18825 [Acidimicrobiales bacterium]